MYTLSLPQGCLPATVVLFFCQVPQYAGRTFSQNCSSFALGFPGSLLRRNTIGTFLPNHWSSMGPCNKLNVCPYFTNSRPKHYPSLCCFLHKGMQLAPLENCVIPAVPQIKILDINSCQQLVTRVKATPRKPHVQVMQLLKTQFPRSPGTRHLSRL